ncbi:WxL domain-containing protein [Lactiplantibacillus mudanjiangensis]|uniref:WxL domain-containing protein [Lactobacillus sp.] n=1 Tax=Lactiplantibacillus mudanjiangensis TaxID=1296538 RepID=A0A660E2G0_9LACO|nr:WxL domain-containing protein [Lactiplantibacillus mudanjiangensis]VDG22459.1 WxL domain-containing protein [Lactobacillus sp.] [Lactiplantibacillus mudanjiangensis]VDG27008.1 WxL domain-containing protein [Lactobacillus sp.] [Lactiplantibacillus mudanjiangensis]VDG32108.1 WxL domain-containing protein [Lactobacillus sp.] [Lactiplantibacillus mudanjiangensis]
MSKFKHLTWWLLSCGSLAVIGSGLVTPVQAAQQSPVQIELAPNNDETAVTPVDPNDPSKPYPGDSVDPGNSGTGSKGSLTIDFISNLTFEATSVSSGPVTVAAKNQLAMVQVTDRRDTGAGWTLQVVPEAPSNGKQTLATSIDLGAVKIKAASTNVSAAPQLVSRQLTAGQVNNVLVADKNAGIGTWLLVLNQSNPATKLTIHDTQLTTGDYQGTMTWMLTDAPSS